MARPLAGDHYALSVGVRICQASQEDFFPMDRVFRLDATVPAGSRPIICPHASDIAPALPEVPVFFSTIALGEAHISI